MKNILNILFKKYDELILEEYIKKQEIQVAVINGVPIGAIELIEKIILRLLKLNIQKKLRPNM